MKIRDIDVLTIGVGRISLTPGESKVWRCIITLRNRDTHCGLGRTQADAILMAAAHLKAHREAEELES